MTPAVAIALLLCSGNPWEDLMGHKPNLWTDPQARFFLDLPVGWEAKEREGLPVVDFWKNHPDNGFVAHVTVEMRALPPNVVACARIGVGSLESSALICARLSGIELQKFLATDAPPTGSDTSSLMSVLEAAQNRNKDSSEPLAVLAAFGGFETAMLVGLVLVAASERHLILADGMTAFAALLIASRLSPAVTDYCLYCRSQGRKGIDEALNLFSAAALLEVGVESADGTGATLAWPLVRTAAALLTEVGDASEPSRTVPGALV